MSKNAQPRHQLNIRFTGEDKAELLQNLEAYLDKYKITKADFIAQCIQMGIANDLASNSSKVLSVGTGRTDRTIALIEQKMREIEERLGK